MIECTTSGVAACWQSLTSYRSGGDIELSPGTLDSWDGEDSESLLSLEHLNYGALTISCDKSGGGDCIWKGETGKRVVQLRHINEDLTLTSITIQDGDAYLGGGLHFESVHEAVILNLVLFLNNHATRGGAIYIEDAFETITLNGCTFTGNTAGSQGPDLYNDFFEDVVMNGCPAGKNPFRLFHPFFH